MNQSYFLSAGKGVFTERKPVGEPCKVFQTITGHLVNINFKESEFGQLMRLHIVDESNFYNLSLFTHSRAAQSFFWLARNLRLEFEMTFKIYSVQDKDFFTIEQFGAPVQRYFGKENMHELPVSNEEKRPYFKKMIETEIIPVLHKKMNPFPYNQAYKPIRTGLQGGYFDDFKTVGRVVGPVSSIEKEDRRGAYGQSKIIDPDEQW